MSDVFGALHAALRNAQGVNRMTAEATYQAIGRHEDAGHISAREAEILRWMNWGSALDPFAARDPEWLTALKPDDGRRYPA
ncbi:hypothetical protein KVH02_11665 [Streptomyces olivaceus]|uniref:Integrase n=1 Tax=Streptomyces olivaceus TaxID=47716 RepID=A0ABS7W1V1_STROV|nr:hypothetical protein [Streptomyces olivaceus]MBZ6088978.1 hypothetical protein [Streptomyces olivaceus]MBZ6095648.1 hypothetical protein [Streptomyces olivaceus]MBZ6119917.1 hypothetical protein [Streptomyces olivaceus]MBZ6151468.1 hypothetical protein [Streptomyces olivaceus]MBZ6298410.1 hypothetical protein [Streptomyces olivaceus]